MQKNKYHIFMIKRDKINFVHMVIIFEDYYLFSASLSSIILVVPKRLNCVLHIFPLSLSMPGIVISSLPFQNI